MNAKRRRLLRPLLFVIPVVLGALSGLTCDALTIARERSRRARCRCHLECCGVGYGCHLYSTDHEGAFPPTLGHLFPDYVAFGAVWLCPSAGKATNLEDEPHFSRDDYTPDMFGDTHTDYVYVSGLREDDPPDYVLAFDDEWNHDGDGVNVCFIDCRRVKGIRDIGEIHELLAKQEKELAAKGRKMKVLRPAWSRYSELPPPRLWYFRRARRAVVVGVIAALALVLVVRTVRRGRKPGSDDAAQPER